MKHLKKLGSVLLALVMVLALAAPAFATPTTTTAPGGDGPVGDPGQGNDATATGSITVKNAVEGASTTIYKIFDLAQYDQTTGAYIYKVNSAWESFFTEGGAGAAYVIIADNGDVSWDENMSNADNMKAFVAAAMAYAKTNPSGLVSQTKENNTGEKDSAVADKIQTYTLTFDNLALGYWLVSSTDGTMCSLNTNAPDAVITNKNPQSVIDKKPVGSSTTEIGQEKEYEITFPAYPTGVKYTVTDTAAKGLSFSQEQFDNMTITADGQTLDANNYTATKKDNGFEIVFDETYVADLPAEGTTIVISYSMTVTSDAIVEQVENDVVLEYGPNGVVKDESKPKVYTYSFDLVKTNPNKDLLPGAEFKLYYDEEMTREVPLVKIGDTQYRVAVGEEDTVDVIVVTGGKVNIAGLDAKTYYLKETKAPTGYNPADGAIEVEIVAVKDTNGELTGAATVNGKATTAVVTDSKYTSDGVAVENNTGTLLPSTGGIGTTIFYIVGGILVLGAVVLLITKRRTSVDDE